MQKYMYWSKTNGKFIEIYVVIGEELVQLFYADLTPFKEMSLLAWNMLVHEGNAKYGWE